MSASLVGSEMCIRDRCGGALCLPLLSRRDGHGLATVSCLCGWRGRAGPVSYTHLTLPTICSV
eukprot:7021829-Alexandrium_andersonii.AAC.1